MKGAIFIAFNQMVEDVVGIRAWEQLLQEVAPASGGIYTSVEDVDDTELFALVEALADIIGQPMAALVESFGCYLFSFLNEKYPVFTASEPNFFSFIKSIDGVIHKEVRKLYSNTQLPSISCEQLDDKTLEMTYYSPKKLCILAEGLIRGAADYYKTDYTLQHNRCMHRGDKQCVFKISLL